METSKISLLVKFVDDLGGAMDVGSILMLEEIMNGFIDGLSVKREDNDISISYLNCKINRRDDNTVGFIWLLPSYSSRQIINFHSNHSNYMKKNVVKEYIISSAIKISTDENIFKTIMNLKKTLRRSNYPDNFFHNYIHQSMDNLGYLEIASTIGSPSQLFDFKRELMVKQMGIRNSNVHRNDGVKKRRLDRFISIPFNRILFQRSEFQNNFCFQKNFKRISDFRLTTMDYITLLDWYWLT